MFQLSTLWVLTHTIGYLLEEHAMVFYMFTKIPKAGVPSRSIFLVIGTPSTHSIHIKNAWTDFVKTFIKKKMKQLYFILFKFL